MKGIPGRGEFRGQGGSGVTRTRIIELGRNACCEVDADDTGVLIDAADYYRAFYVSAMEATRYIVMSGWQFDSGVPLLRGADAPPDHEVRFLAFLNGLCEQKPDLQVFILAWDFHVVLAAEREWMQRIYFDWMTSPRFHFLFDDCPVVGGSHHQKFALFDGTHGYLGGMDVCEDRWDDRRHRGDNALRSSRGKPHKPYHDVQAWLSGRRATHALEEIFLDRWRCAGGEPPVLSAPEAPRARRPAGLLPVGPARVALSRTDPRADRETIREVERLFVDAITAAEHLVYLETQYFSSRRIYEALATRMRDGARSRLEIVVVVNERAEALKEELAVGLRQAQNLERLREIATATGHALGIFYSLCDGVTADFRTTYIHSKVVVVDDRFLSVGSANLTNRSMGTDSELHVSWEAMPDDAPQARVRRAIRRVRVSLLAEHAGESGIRAARALSRGAGLVAHLEHLAARPGARLQRHEGATPAQRAVAELIDPQDLPFDPDTTPDGELQDDAPLAEPVEEGPSGPSVGEAVGSLWDSLREHALPLIRTYTRR
jgi:phosphatidylserine/phosphatidylglycerophosphate/cardiolipin synthase-like enzyme